MTDDEEFADALSALWSHGLKARTYMNGETEIFVTPGETMYRRLKSWRSRAQTISAAEAKRLRKAEKRGQDIKKARHMPG